MIEPPRRPAKASRSSESSGFLRRRIDPWTQSPAWGSTSHRSSLREALRKRNVDTHLQILAFIDSNFSGAIDAPKAKLRGPERTQGNCAPQTRTSIGVFGSSGDVGPDGSSVA